MSILEFVGEVLDSIWDWSTKCSENGETAAMITLAVVWMILCLAGIT